MTTQSLTLNHFLSRFVLQIPAADAPLLPPGRRAAVLVPLVEREIPGLLLTRRSAHLRKHAGQVAFPGGVQDAEDASPIATALREAEEEVGIRAEQVRIIGSLPAVTSSTGFQVTPVIGIIPPDLPLRLNPAEVESAFEMPLAEALRLSRYSPLEVHRRGRTHQVWLSWYQDYFVWGMTAGIIRALGHQIATV